MNNKSDVLHRTQQLVSEPKVNSVYCFKIELVLCELIVFKRRNIGIYMLDLLQDYMIQLLWPLECVFNSCLMFLKPRTCRGIFWMIDCNNLNARGLTA